MAGVKPKQGMSNVDVAALAAELAPLVVGSRVDRIYQPARNRVLVRLRRTGHGRIDLLFELGRFLTATRRPPENPDKPSMLAQVLRTQFENARVTAFQQLGFDRILRMETERGDGRRALVFELFGEGNLLVLDEAGTITLPMRAEEYAARLLRKGEPYTPPPGSAHPFALDAAGLRAAGAGARRDLVRFLALDLGFGPLWAEELCLRAGLERSLSPPTMDDAQWQAVHAQIERLGREVRGNLLEPALVFANPALPTPSDGDAAGAVPDEAEARSTASGTLAAVAAGAMPSSKGAAAQPAAAGSAPAKPDEPKPVDAVPFTLRRYAEPAFSHEEAPSFWEALDSFFLGADAQAVEQALADPRQARLDEARGKLKRQVDQTEEAIARLAGEEEEARADGDALYACFAQVQGILDALGAARRSHGWEAVERILRQARADGNPLAAQVQELTPHDGLARLRLDVPGAGTRDVRVDLRLSVQQNADERYAEAKRARSRREGAEAARDEALKRLRAVEEAGLDAFGAPPVRAQGPKHHFWFESYRWTVTPGGLIAVGGRNAAQNDAVVKKYLRDGDRYVHADIHGAPSVVVRPYDAPAGEVAPLDLRVAAQFAACASRAWRLGASATAYWVTAQQVSKTPRSGEFVPRGAWIIHGRRNVEDALPMEWWIGPLTFGVNGTPLRPSEVEGHHGRTVRKLAGGPRAGLEPYGAAQLRLVPGPVEPGEAAARVARTFGVTMDEAQAVMPPGPVAFLEGPADPGEAA